MQKISTMQSLYPEQKLPIYTLKYTHRQPGCICNNANFQYAIKLRGSICITLARCYEILHFSVVRRTLICHYGF